MKKDRILKKSRPVFSGITFILLSGVFTVSCNSEQNNHKELTNPVTVNKDRQIIVSKDYVIDKAESQVKWYADEADQESFGTIDFVRGQLGLGKGEILGGTFKLDLKNVSAAKPKANDTEQQLVERLKSEDFFDVNSYPEGELEILSVSTLSDDEALSVEGLEATHQIEATLTLRGVTRIVTFPAHIEMVDGKVVAETNQLIISPAEWGAETATIESDIDTKSTIRIAITITANRV